VRDPAVFEGSGIRSAWPYMALVLVATGYLWEVLTLAGVPVARDMQMFFVPQKHLLWEALHEGRIPLWTQFIGTGSPFLANVQSGVFYPPHWLYAVLPFYAAFNLLVVLHFALGGLFACLLCRRLGMSPTAAYIGAATWMLGGYFASLLNLVNALQGATWAPALGWALLRVLGDQSHRALGVLAAVGICAVLAGEPQSFVFSCGAATVVAGLALTRARPDARGLTSLAARLSIAAVIVAGLAMIQILPTLELLDQSSRGAGLSYGEAAGFALQPIRAIHFFIPPDYRDPQYAFGVRSVIGRGDPWLFSTYLGALWPIFAYFGWRARARRREVALWSAIGLGAVLIAFGDSTPIFRWLFDYVPGFAAFRFPEKYLFGTAFAAMLLAGWGAEEMIEGAHRRGDVWFVGGYAVAVSGLLIAFRLAKEPIRVFAAGFGNDRMMDDFDFAYGVWSQNVGKLVVFVVVVAALLWLYRKARLSAPVFGLLLAGLVTADLVVAHRSLNPLVEREFYETRPLLFDHIPIEEVRRDYRLRASRFDSLSGTVPVIRGVPLEAQKWLWQQIVAPNVGQTWQVLQQDAWDAIKLGRIRDELQIHRILPDAQRRWALLRLHSVKYVHQILDVDAAGEAREIPLDTLPGHLYELERPLPRAYVVPHSRRYATPTEVINAVLDPNYPLRELVALTGSTPASTVPSDPEAVRSNSGPVSFPGVHITQAADEELRLVLDPITEDGEWLVLTDSFYPGWTVSVDGEERPLEVANFFFRGVPLEPGDRNVVFSYRSRPFEHGRLISLISLAIAVGLFAAGEVGQRRGARATARSGIPTR